MSGLPIRTGPEAFLLAYSRRLRPLRIAHARAYWRFATQADAEAQAQVERLEQEISDLHADAAPFDAIGGWLEDGVDDPLVDRQLQLLRLDYRDAQVDIGLRREIIRRSLEVEEVHSTFRAELDRRKVTSNELDRTLLTETDERRRRAAWKATRDVGLAVGEDVRELARLRNEQARTLGFDDFFALALDSQEMDGGGLFGVLDSLRERTDAPWAARKARLDEEFGALRGKSPGALEPWDYPERFLQAVPRSGPGRSTDPWFRLAQIERFAKRTFSGIGLPIEDLWRASDMMPRDGKYPHAFCIGVDNPSDVRVLCNLDATTRWMETTLHEFGHAIYNAGIDAGLPYPLREAAHTFVTEAVAMFFGRQARDLRWLKAVPAIPEDRAQAAREDLAESQLVFVRWALTVTGFERGLYADPEQDLDALWWSLASDIQGIERPDGHEGGDWAGKVHVACYPVYYQNYVLGELLASQFQAALKEQVGDSPTGIVGRTEVGSFFAALFHDGRRLRWDRAVERHTGAPLSPEHWVRDFAAEV